MARVLGGVACVEEMALPAYPDHGYVKWIMNLLGGMRSDGLIPQESMGITRVCGHLIHLSEVQKYDVISVPESGHYGMEIVWVFGDPYDRDKIVRFGAGT